MIKKYKEQGFTLVELLVVISIIAILSVVSVAGYTQFIQKAKESNCVNELTQLRDMMVAADEDDDNYFIFSDGVIYTGTVKSSGALKTSTDSKQLTSDTTNATADTKDSKSLAGAVKKYFPDMLTSQDGEVRELTITDGKVITYTWKKDGKTITTTWTVETGKIEVESTADAS